MAIPRRHNKMSTSPVLNNGDTQHPPIKNLSIEIEPSYPLIVALAEFFRAQKRAKQSLELCRLGLNHFPGDLGLRLGMALSYLDLSEKDKAWMEIRTVVQELNRLASILDSIAKHFRNKAQNHLSEWFQQLSQLLSTSPEDGPEETTDSPVPSLFPEEEFQSGVNSQVHENFPGRDPEPPTHSQTAEEKISPVYPGKTTNEKERPKEMPDSNLLSTLTSWLSQLKESKV
jgi:hypothetical protein